MIEIPCVQLSPEWWEARRGIPTSSEFHRILTPKTCKPSASQDEYINELIADRIWQDPKAFQDSRPTTRAMQDGRDYEPEARDWYALECGTAVRQVGFCLSECRRWGCSPDGVVGDDGLLELKVPLMKTHIAYLREGILPWDYRCQVHGQLVVSGRKWVDFVSYNGRLPKLRVRVVADPFTDLLRQALEDFDRKYKAALATVIPPDPSELSSF